MTMHHLDSMRTVAIFTAQSFSLILSRFLPNHVIGMFTLSVRCDAQQFQFGFCFQPFITG